MAFISQPQHISPVLFQTGCRPHHMNKNIKIKGKFFFPHLKCWMWSLMDIACKMYSARWADLCPCKGQGHNEDNMMKRSWKVCVLVTIYRTKPGGYVTVKRFPLILQPIRYVTTPIPVGTQKWKKSVKTCLNWKDPYYAEFILLMSCNINVVL